MLFILLLIPQKSVVMMKEIVLMLVATINVAPLAARYLLVELQDTMDIEEPLAPNLIEEPLGEQPHAGRTLE